MHVLIIHQAFAAPSEAGGTRHYEFARHLASHGHQVTVVAGRVSYLTAADPAQREPADDRGIEIVRSYTPRSLHKSFVHRVLSYMAFTISSAVAALRVRDVDIVVGTSPPIFQGVTAWLVARIKRVPFVFEVRDLWPDFAIELRILTNPLLIAAGRLVERSLYRHADRLLVNSPGFVDHVHRVSRRMPALIPNGADPALFAPERYDQRLREQWHAADRFVVLYAGAHGTANALETVLDAAALLHDNPVFLFVLIGDGKEKQALQRAARAAQLRNVHFEPAQPKDVMPAVIAAADVCLATLRNIPLFRTTYPNKVFDYMAAGKPTVVAIDGVIRHVVEESGGGVFVPPGDARAMADALVRLEADRAACAQMGARARAFVGERFNRHDQAAAFRALLTECTNEARA